MRTLRGAGRRLRGKQQASLRLQIAGFGGASIAFVILGCIEFYIGIHSYWPLEAKSLNLLGDFIGGTVGALWSLAGLILIYVAFLGQQLQILNQERELELNREELSATREELRGQKEQLEQQNANITIQRDENTFFKLLELHNQIVSSLDCEFVDDENGRYIVKRAKGRDCFKLFYGEFSEQYGKRKKSLHDVPLRVVIDDAYMTFFEVRQGDIGHYFRNLYHIVRFVKESGLEPKRRYINILRAQLSSFELIMLFYNCLSSLGRERFKELVELYQLLETLPRRFVIEQAHFGEYSPKAYSETDVII